MPYPMNHIHLRSKDPHKAVQWYEKHFGARVVSEGEGLFGTVTISTQLEGNLRLNISSQPPGKSLERGSAEFHLGLEHFGFDVPDLAKELERLEKENVRVRLPMTTLRGTKLAYSEGPDDVLIGLVEAG